MAVKKIVVGHRADFAAGLTGGLVSVHIRYLPVLSLALSKGRARKGTHVLRNKLRQTNTSPFSLNTSHNPRFRYHPPHSSKQR